MKVTLNGCELSVSLRGSNGWGWTFSHKRSTESDAANLHALLTQQIEVDSSCAEARLNCLHRCIDQLKRSNAALRGHLKRAKKPQRDNAALRAALDRLHSQCVTLRDARWKMDPTSMSHSEWCALWRAFKAEVEQACAAAKEATP